MIYDPDEQDRMRELLDEHPPTDRPPKRCRRLSWHVPHDDCPGVSHDHEARCCTVHGTHTTPHKGCVLR